MSDVTQLLARIEAGDGQAGEELLPLVYDELRRLAQQRMSQEKAGHTLQATALVHEVYVRLIGNAELQWDSRGHFFAAAAQAMRRILIERARSKARHKRGGRRQRMQLDVALVAADEQADDLLALDEALNELQQQDPQLGQIVLLRFFSGLSVEETAAALDLSPRTVKREWSLARAWLYRALRGDEEAT